MAGTAKKATLEELQEIIKDLGKAQRELIASHAKTEESLRDSQRKTEKSLRKYQKESKERTNKLEELFTGQWGKLMESLVKGDLIKLLNERGITVEQQAQGT